MEETNLNIKKKLKKLDDCVIRERTFSRVAKMYGETRKNYINNLSILHDNIP